MDDAAQSLFPALLGPEFLALPEPLRRLHRPGRHRFDGNVEVQRGSGLLSRACAWAARLPPAWSGPIRVEIDAGGQHERWARLVRGHAMRSKLWTRDGALCERLGPLSFRFRLAVEHERIIWRVTGVRLLGLPLPVNWFRNVRAVESAEGSRYRFDVHAALPGIGLLVHYRGWLDVD